MTEQELIDALKAQVNCLRHCLEQARNDKDREAFERCYGRTLAMTPEQCLAEVKAKAIDMMMAVLDRSTDAMSPLDVVYVFEIEQYANKLREQAK